jgi:hypothetical protein
MDNLDERFLVYTALLILCSFLSVLVSLPAGIWTFLQIATVIEIIYWITFSGGDDPAQNC